MSYYIYFKTVKTLTLNPRRCIRPEANGEQTTTKKKFTGAGALTLMWVETVYMKDEERDEMPRD